MRISGTQDFTKGTMSDPPKPSNLSSAWEWLRAQPVLAKLSYFFGFCGAVWCLHDFHHPASKFGHSSQLLFLALVLYLVGLQRSR